MVIRDVYYYISLWLFASLAKSSSSEAVLKSSSPTFYSRPTFQRGKGIYEGFSNIWLGLKKVVPWKKGEGFVHIHLQITNFKPETTIIYDIHQHFTDKLWFPGHVHN